MIYNKRWLSTAPPATNLSLGASCYLEDPDMLEAMLTKERVSHYAQVRRPTIIPSDDDDQTASSASCAISPTARRNVSSWMFQLCDFYNFDRQVVIYANNYIDRMLIKNPSTYTSSQKQYLVLSSSAFWLAIKTIHSCECESKSTGQVVGMSLHQFVNWTSRNQFTVRDIEIMEQVILKDLHWRLYPPTTMEFVNCFHLPSEHVLQKAKFIAELLAVGVVHDGNTTIDFYSSYAPHTIGFATVLTAMHLCGYGDSCPAIERLEHNDILLRKECQLRLSVLFRQNMCQHETDNSGGGTTKKPMAATKTRPVEASPPKKQRPTPITPSRTTRRRRRLLW